jgi:hypothetical protein
MAEHAYQALPRHTLFVAQRPADIGENQEPVRFSAFAKYRPANSIAYPNCQGTFV